MKTTKVQLERMLKICRKDFADTCDALDRERTRKSTITIDETTSWNPKITTYATLHKMSESMVSLVKEAVELVKLAKQR